MPVHRPATACTCLPNNKYKCYFSSLYWPITFPSVLLSNFCAFSVNVRVQHPSPPQPPKTQRGLADRGGEGADDDAKGAEAGEDAQDAEDADEPQERHPRKRLYGQRKKRHCRARARALEQATQELSQWSNRRSANGRPKAAGWRTADDDEVEEAPAIGEEGPEPASEHVEPQLHREGLLSCKPMHITYKRTRNGEARRANIMCAYAGVLPACVPACEQAHERVRAHAFVRCCQLASVKKKSRLLKASSAGEPGSTISSAWTTLLT